MTSQWTRREVMKNLCKMGAFSSLAMSPLASMASAPPPCRPFSIVLHGLFVLDVFSENENYIRISTPKVDGHKYLAGPWSDCVTTYSTVSDYHEEPLWDSHVAMLPSTGGMPVLKSSVGDPDHNKAYLSFRVPYPTAIRPLRCFDESEVDYPHCCIEATRFPLVLALEYDYLPRFSPINGTYLDRTKNYHIFAEPPDKMPNCDVAIEHGKSAMDRLLAMFPHPPSSYVLPKDKTNCYKDADMSGAPCGNKYEESGLSDLKKDCKSVVTGESIHLPMCANFIVM